MNITEDYCSYEVAKLLKEKGFDYQGFDYIDFEGEVIRQDRPTHQMAMKWLREEKNISIVIDDDEIPLSYKYIIKKYSINDKSGVLILKLDSLPFIKYEIAVEAALKYTLENLI